MNKSEKYIARLMVFLLDILLYDIQEWSIASLVALNDFSTLFRYNYNVIILVDYLHSLKIYTALTN